VNRFWAGALLGLLALSACSKHEFQLSGTVTIASSLQHKLAPGNTVMFIIAKNRGDVPLAVHRIVNPRFPVSFSMNDDDLIVPEIPGDTPLRIQVQMNSHGAVGTPLRGDLEGLHPNVVYPGDKRIHVVIDRKV
jgi:hypothetical protein